MIVANNILNLPISLLTLAALFIIIVYFVTSLKKKNEHLKDVENRIDEIRKEAREKKN